VENGNRKHAIVIGGSMGGLLAARVLSDRYEKVTLIDRDTFPEAGQHRRGVPQSVHTHGLLASGRRILERYFSGLGQELIGLGAIEGDLLKDSRWCFEGGCLNKSSSGLHGLLVSRPLLEGVVRRRLLAIANIESIQNCVVENVTATDDKQRVTGVRLASGETLPADLVIDSSGRASHAPAWLEALGYAKPQEERVEVAIGYSTRLFRRDMKHLDGDGAVIIPPTPEGKRGGVMLAQEGGRWTVTLISYFGNYAPLELAGFIDYSKTLPAPFIHEVVSQSEPLCNGVSARFPASVRKRYEKLDRFPKGFLALGDAICSFNPIYGQGMSAASQQAVALEESLDANGDISARDFFQRAAKVVDNPWSMAVGADLKIPETVGPRNAGVNFINWYIGKLHKAAHRDPEAALAFVMVANLLAPPPSIMAPRIAMRVLWGNLRA
jgi:2-polyprenyl-6-methoxyphenol hydroxylase-like FAD-dependent oxidoreductase